MGHVASSVASSARRAVTSVARSTSRVAPIVTKLAMHMASVYRCLARRDLGDAYRPERREISEARRLDRRWRNTKADGEHSLPGRSARPVDAKAISGRTLHLSQVRLRHYPVMKMEVVRLPVITSKLPLPRKLPRILFCNGVEPHVDSVGSLFQAQCNDLSWWAL